MHDKDIFYPYCLELFTLDCERLLAWISTVPSDQIVILYSLELIPEERIRLLHQALQDLDRDHKVIWVLNEICPYSQDIDAMLGSTLVRLNFDLMIHYIYMDVSQVCQTNPKWNPDTGRFLFLIGKPAGFNRIGLLYQFKQESLLSQCDWSLHEKSLHAQNCRRALAFLGNDDYHLFVQDHIRNLDRVQLTLYDNKPLAGSHYSGYPFDASMYANTSFRVIAETQWHGVPLTTEKTWITIANMHPFIMAGYQNNLEQLRLLGFRTFEKYLPIPTYDKIADETERRKAVVENTRYWLQNIGRHQKEIEKDVVHNHQCLESHVGRTVDNAKLLYNRIGYSEVPWTRLLPWFSMEQTGWMSFYYRIRDQSWPECYSSQNFDQLPQHIQQECIEQFGYRKENF